MEAALILPVILLIMVGLFEIGRAYQTFQVLTNAAREGARASILPSGTSNGTKDVVLDYMEGGALIGTPDMVNVNRSATMTVNGQIVGASQVTITYPFQFIVLQPVARLVVGDSTVGGAFQMTTSSLMRNEVQ